MSQDDGRPFPPPTDSAGDALPTEPAPEPATTVPPVTTIETRPPASIGDRLVAQLVDGLLAFGLFVLLAAALVPRFNQSFAVVPRLNQLFGTGFDPRYVEAAIALGITSLVLLTYFILFEKQLGMTLGKLAAGVRVRSKNGGRISGRASIARNVIRIFEGLTLYLVSALLILATKRGQRIGDLLAGTVVIRHEAPRPVRVLALLLATLVAVSGVVAGLAMNEVGPVSPDRLALIPPSPEPSPTAGGRPRVANVIVADSRTSDVNRTSFLPQTPEIYARFTLADVPAGSQLRAVWVAEQAAGMPSGQTLDEATIADAGGPQSQGVFPYPRPPNGWPLGTYRVDFFLNGQFERAARFTIDASAPAPAVSPGPTSRPTVGATPGATPGPTPATLLPTPSVTTLPARTATPPPTADTAPTI